MNMTLTTAFGRFGAKPSSSHSARSAMAADGALVLNCSSARFVHPAQGVLRYEDRLSREPSNRGATERLSQHLTLARDGALPVRRVVSTIGGTDSGSAVRSIHIRPDLVGRVVIFDGDNYAIDFVRRPEVQGALPERRNRRRVGRT